MSYNSEIVHNTNNPLNVKVRQLQANMANLRLQSKEEEDRRKIFRLMLQAYLGNPKDQFVQTNTQVKNQENALENKKIQKRNALIEFIRKFRKMGKGE